MRTRLDWLFAMLFLGLPTLALCANSSDIGPAPPPLVPTAELQTGDPTYSADFLLAQQPGTAPTRPQAPPIPLTPRPGAPDANALALAPTQRNAQSATNRAPGYSLAGTPNMIGDTLGVGFVFFIESAVGGPGRIAGNVPLGDSSVKISSDCSPLPVDRVFFDYNHFHNALITANGADISLNRYTFGAEKTFFDRTSSVEIKAPIDGGLNDVQFLNGPTAANEGTLFGTFAIVPKVLLHDDSCWAASAGLAIGLPTSPNVELRGPQQPFRVFDDSVHLAPFLGLLLTPNDRWFSISYLQLDFDANGNRVFLGDTPQGRLRIPTLMYVDCSVGYWLFRHDPCCYGPGRYLSGLAPVVELHYTTTLQDAEGVSSIIRPQTLRVDILNLTAGLFFKLGESAGLMVGGVAPLRTAPGDKEFDAEVLVQFNRWF